MQIVDAQRGTRGFQTDVAMRDGVTLNTFVFLPADGGPRFPVIVHRTPYGITTPAGAAVTDPAQGWVPSATAPLYGPILRGWQAIVAHGYVAVYQGAAATPHRAKTASMPTMQPTGTTPWSGSRASPGPISVWVSRAPLRPPPPH